MYGLWSLSLFLITSAFLSVCTNGNSQAKTERASGCQNTVVKLNCLNKSYIIDIISVFYGRTLPGRMICRSPPYSELSDESICDQDQNDVTKEVKDLCENKNNCNITLKKETFGKDGCPNVHKYMDVVYKCEDVTKFKRNEGLVRLVSPSSSMVMRTSTITSSSKAIQISSTIHPTSTLVVRMDTVSAVYGSRPSSHSSSMSSSLPHSVSVTTVSHTQPATSVAASIENPSLKTTKPASKTFEHSATSAGQHGSMKLFRFILSFHIIHEESIHKHTASSVVWFMFGLLVGLFMVIAVLVYYRLKQVQQERKGMPNKVAYYKQNDCTDGTIEEKVILHPKELEALEMESQVGETV